MFFFLEKGAFHFTNQFKDILVVLLCEGVGKSWFPNYVNSIVIELKV